MYIVINALSTETSESNPLRRIYDAAGGGEACRRTVKPVLHLRRRQKARSGELRPLGGEAPREGGGEACGILQDFCGLGDPSGLGMCQGSYGPRGPVSGSNDGLSNPRVGFETPNLMISGLSKKNYLLSGPLLSTAEKNGHEVKYL